MSTGTDKSNHVISTRTGLLTRVATGVFRFALASAYFGLVTPIGVAMRAVGADPLQNAIDRRAASYWRRRPRGRPPLSRYFRQF
jgi:hypothetical protein